MATRASRPFSNPRERVFRRASALVVDGDRALPDAVEVPACSVDREEFRAAEDVLDLQRWPTYTLVLWMRVNDLPPSVASAEGQSYDWKLEDLPEEDNEAHCEVRLVKRGEQFSKKKPKSSVAREEAKKLLAERMRVLR